MEGGFLLGRFSVFVSLTSALLPDKIGREAAFKSSNCIYLIYCCCEELYLFLGYVIRYNGVDLSGGGGVVFMW